MFHIDLFGNLQPTSIYIVRPSGQVLGNIDEIINETTATISVGLNQQYTFEAEVNKVDGKTDWYEYLQEGMYLFLENIGLFKMYQNPVLLDGVKETKTVTAYSVDSELEDKTIQFGINLGKKDESMEYLVQYDDDETEVLINPYTGIPYDWIVLYNTFHVQLHTLDNKITAGDYGGEYNEKGDLVITDPDAIAELTEYFDLIPRLKSKVVYSENTDGSQDSTLIEYVITEKDPEDEETVISYALTNQFRIRIEELIQFYVKYRKQLSLLDLVLDTTDGNWSVGIIDGVDNQDYSLCNKRFQFDINETIYSFLTQTLAKSIECVVNFDILNRKVNITPVANIGYDTGIVIGYDTLVNTLNIATEDDRLATRLYVTGGDDLDISRVNFGSNYIEDLSYKLNVRDSNGNRLYVDDALAEKYAQYCEYREEQRAQYIEDSILYEEYNEKVSELENRVPNDGLKVEYDNYTSEELLGLLTNYKNLLVTLTSLYKEDYGEAGLNQDGSINENYIKNTEYWYDYQAYLSVIELIKYHINNGKSSEWDTSEANAYKELVTAWETDWSLYGTIELQNKVKTYQQNMDLLAEESVIRVNTSGYEIKTWDGTGAGALTEAEKALYGGDSSKYKYALYMDYYNNMVDAQAALSTLQTEVNNYKSLRDATVTEREEIMNNVAMSTYFTADECKTLNRLLRDSDYSNENIVTTSIDSIREKIEHMKELLEDGKDQVSITSRPQITFTTEVNNLMGLPEFKPFWSSFLPGNYVYVQYKDDSYVKLRMIGYQYNPCLPTAADFTVTFSNFTRSRSYYHDWGSLLGNSSSVSGGRSGGSSSGGSGGYGDSDDIDVTISNTMLSKLLNTELFGTRVTDVILDTIQANVMSARSATFNNLSVVATTGDYADLSNKPNLDYLSIYFDNGVLKIGTPAAGEDAFTVSTDGVLQASNAIIYGTVYATAGQIGGCSISNGVLQVANANITSVDASKMTTGYIRSQNYNGSNGAITNTAGSVLNLENGQFNFGGGKLKFDGSTLTANGSITASYLTALNYVRIHDSAGTARIAMYSNTTDTPALEIGSGFSAIRLLKPTTITGNTTVNGTLSSSSFSTTGAISGGAISGSSVTTTGNITSSGGTISCQSACHVVGSEETIALHCASSNYNWQGIWNVSKSSWIICQFPYAVTITSYDYEAGDVYIPHPFWTKTLCTNTASSTLGTSSYRWNRLYAANSVDVSSDRKLKDNISDITFAKELIMSLNPVTFMWKDGDHRRKQMGLIAQEASKVCKDIGENLSFVRATYNNNGKYSYDKNGEYYGEDVDDDDLTWGISYDQLIAPTIKVVQELYTEIQTLKQQLRDLKEKQ